MKVYTIIANFSIGDYGDYDQLWTANYKSREDAVEAFRFKLKETGALTEDGKVVEYDKEGTTEWEVAELFDYLIANGCRYRQDYGSEKNAWFVRGEELQEKFDEKVISWK